MTASSSTPLDRPSSSHQEEVSIVGKITAEEDEEPKKKKKGAAQQVGMSDRRKMLFSNRNINIHQEEEKPPPPKDHSGHILHTEIMRLAESQTEKRAVCSNPFSQMFI